MSSGNLPVAGLFCATFLKPEMLHVYRHITGLTSFRPVVLTQKPEGSWAVDKLEVIPRSPWRFAARGVEKLVGRPWQISSGEVRLMLDVLKREQCSVLHIFFGNVAIHLLPLLRQCPIPVVISFHGSDVAGSMASPDYAMAERELFALASAIACRSKQLVGQVRKLGAPAEKLRLMRTIIPEIPFTPRAHPPDGAWRIVQAARLVPKKGVAHALRAFAQFTAAYPRSTFTIAGDGPLKDELRALADELGIGNRVQFAGFLSQPDLQALFAKSHIYLHPSETSAGDVEGVPNTLLEAMAGGLPVVATIHGGIPEVISSGVNGLLCPEGDAEALRAALFQLVSDEPFYRSLGENAATSMREEFSSARQVAAVEAIYSEVILAHTSRKI